jgi:hypothetical protein
MAIIVSVNLSTETARRLSERAAREGQTLEGLLHELAVQEALGSGNGNRATDELQADDERPWRGILVLDYAPKQIFKTEREVNVCALPSLPPEVIIDPRRLTDDSE